MTFKDKKVENTLNFNIKITKLPFLRKKSTRSFSWTISLALFSWKPHAFVSLLLFKPSSLLHSLSHTHSLITLTVRRPPKSHTKMPSSSSVTLVSKCTIYPEQKSETKPLKLSVSDLPMLSCQYIQKGVLLTRPPYSIDHLLCSLKHSLSLALTHFPALAGRLFTDPEDTHVHIVCNDQGVDFIQAKAKHLSVHTLLSPNHDVPDCFKEFFTFDKPLSYLAAVQVTELNDGVLWIIGWSNKAIS
jgi:hypothetical protein